MKQVSSIATGVAVFIGITINPVFLGAAVVLAFATLDFIIYDM